MNEVLLWFRKANDKRRAEVGVSLDATTQGERAEAFSTVVRQNSFTRPTGHRDQVKTNGDAGRHRNGHGACALRVLKCPSGKALEPRLRAVQSLARVTYRSLVPARPGDLDVVVGLKGDVLVRKDDDVIAKNDQCVAEFFGRAFAVFEAFVGEDIGLRPHAQERLAAQLREDALGIVYAFRLC